MALTEAVGSVTSSYVGSSCMVSPAPFDSCRAALILALLFLEIMTITVMKSTMLPIKAVAKELIDVTYVRCVRV